MAGCRILRQPAETIWMPSGIPENELLLGNNIDVLKTFRKSSIDMTLCSPPYDELRAYNGFQLDLEGLGRELYRVSKDGAIAAVVINDGTKDFAKSLTTARLTVNWVDRVGWRLFETVIYARHGRPGAWWGQRFRVDHEYILLFLKGDRPKFFDKSHLAVAAKYAGEEWHGTDRLSDGTTKEVVKGREVKGTKCRGTVWHYAASTCEANRLKLEHPATFPDQLAEDIIRCFTQPDELVLDPFSGSGTTCVTAAQWRRRYVGIDVSAAYNAIAQARLETEVKGNLFDMK